jgi:hypothetical protein
MALFISKFKWIMLVCGLLTSTMLLGLFSPDSSLQSNFGETLVTGPENVVVRGWSALIGIIGLMLIYGAFKTEVRTFSLVIAGGSKVIFITIAIFFGKQYMGFGLGTAVIVDTIMILLFILYLIFSGKQNSMDK